MNFKTAINPTLLLVGLASVAGAETFKLSTYYPSPVGVYENLNVTSGSALARDSGNVMVGANNTSGNLDVSVPAVFHASATVTADIGVRGTVDAVATRTARFWLGGVELPPPPPGTTTMSWMKQTFHVGEAVASYSPDSLVYMTQCGDTCNGDPNNYFSCPAGINMTCSDTTYYFLLWSQGYPMCWTRSVVCQAQGEVTGTVLVAQ